MQQRIIFLHSILWFMILSLFGFTAYADVTVEASLSHSSIPVGRAAQLSVTVNGASRSVDVQLPEVQGVRFHNRGQSSRMNMMNGSFSSSISSEYLVQPLQPGSYTIPPIQITVSGTIYASEPITFEATGSVSQSSTSSAVEKKGTTDEAVFIRVTKTGSHYPGEIVPIQLKAYFNQQYRADIQSLPVLQGDGVVMSHLEDKPRQTQESLGGKRYNVLTWETTLSGIKVGEHSIMFTLDASLLIPKKRRSMSTFGGSSLFDDTFFNSFFDDYQRKPIAAVSPEITFKVLSLPAEGQPIDGSFTGAIGTFELKVSANPLTADVGEPITLTMEVSGQGNFDRVESPVFPGSIDWKTYSPTASFNNQGSKYSGIKSFEQAIVAKNDAGPEIPTLSFSYFDPQLKKYVTRTSQPIHITLNNYTNQAMQTTPKVEVQQQRTALAETPTGLPGLAPLHLETGAFSHTISPLFKKVWFMSLAALLFFIFLGLTVYKIRLHRLEQHPEILLKQQQDKTLSVDLELLDQARKNGDSMAFLSGCRAAMQNQLGSLWEMEPSAISLTDLTRRFEANSGLIEVFAAAEQAAYGAATLSADTMATYSAIVARELEELK